MNEIFIPVIGIPAPQGSKRHVGNGIMIENSKRVKPWRQDVKEAALNHYDGEVIDQAVEIEIIFLFARPKSHYGTGKNAKKLKPSAPVFVTSKGIGDIDKLQRSTYDALSESSGGIVIKDDALIVQNRNMKRYCVQGENPGAKITVRTLH
jgi:crossover junction endodeoxyribonuclease RusA